MAKSKAPSKRSRAARRATSPGIDTDKSLKDVALPTQPSGAAAGRPSVLAVHRSAGVQKKARPGRRSQLSARARRRHERGLEMAEAVTGRTGQKMERSLGRARTVQARSKAWDVVNRLAEGEARASNAFAALGDGGDGGDDDDDDGEDGNKGWETDEEMDPEDEAAAAAAAAPVKQQETGVSVPAAADDDGDEIL